MIEDSPTPSKRILLADDDPVIRHLISTLVTREGYTVVAANDGEGALRILRRDTDFRAAIFDMMMPGLKGIDVLRFMRTEKRLMRIPVLMITSEKDLKLMTEIFAAGATAILPKPFSTVQIQTMLHMVMGQNQKIAKVVSKPSMRGQVQHLGLRN